DPFLLIHHWHNHLPGNQNPQDVGVGPHPHCGFSPVTFIFKGAVEHRDSLGNRAVVKNGGTQWMFSGNGITHSERFPKQLVEDGGELEFIQFWVNVPAKFKNKPPYYQPISQAETPLVEEEKSKIWIVSGKYKGTKGVAPKYSPQLLLRGEIQQDGHLDIPIPESFNALIYVLNGNLEIDKKTLVTKYMGILNLDGNNINIKANEDTHFIILSGEPIKEPIATYGPFVMNDQTELMQALKKAQMGKMGVLIEEFD
ncbi:MAG: pirin-like C-terminal cupin domain-containing protein, partial [Bacteroidia bacterium]|nr:pirin-like C-terminal cupin domain-containing protein [Bacteroidia bacterium]